MSVKKYQIAREFRKGVAARILGRAIDPKEYNKSFEEGYSWACRDGFDFLYDALNKYLVLVGEEEISLVNASEEILRNE